MVATPGPLPDLRPAPGALDGDVIRARLPLPDAGFRLVDLDPATDLAEQIDLLYDRGDALEGGAVLFYISASVVLSVDGELFVCLDPAHPETGDSLRDLALVFRERARGPTAFMLECRHAPDPDDPFRSATIVGAAKDAVASASSGIELLIAAHPIAGESDDRPSPLTRALIEALDEPEAQGGLTIARFFEVARESPQIVGTVPCFAHARGRTPFELLPHVEVAAPPPRRPMMSAPEIEASPISEPDLDRMTDPEPVPEARAPFRSEQISIPVALEDAAPGNPEPRAPFRSEQISIPVDFADSVDVFEEPAPPPPAPASTRTVAAVVTLPEQRSFRESESPAAGPPAPRPATVGSAPPASGGSAAPPPKVVVSAPEEARPASVAPPRPASVAPPPPSTRAPPLRAASVPPRPASVVPPPPVSATDHVATGDSLLATGDGEGAQAAYKRALGMLGPSAGGERAEIYVRLGQVKHGQDKRREAIASYEKALSLFPTLDGPSTPLPPLQRTAMEALVELTIAEADWRAVAGAEERLLATITSADERFERLVASAIRWHEAAADPARARAALERARDLRPDDLAVLERLAALYEAAGAVAETLATRRRVAELTRDPRVKAERYFDLGKHCLVDLRREGLGLELFDLALESDPTMLEPLALVARVLADRQEWSELEQAYRRMLERVDHIPKGPVRTEVTFELCRRLGLLFRDHLEDPALGLDAFEDAVTAKPGDLTSRLTTAELARSLGKHDRAAVHLQAAAALDPSRVTTFHDLFEVFQKLRRPDQAYEAACVTMFARQADARERFIFEEHRPTGVPKPAYALRAEGWEWIRVHDRDVEVEAVLAAVTPAAIAARIAELTKDGRLPDLDPASRQDLEKSTVSIVRSFGWASHFLAVPPPAIHIHDDPSLGLAAVMTEEPTVVVGQKVLRGRSLPELAFLVGRHLAYHVGAHELLLYYPSIEELSACFLAAVKIILPEVEAPPAVRVAATELGRAIGLRLTEGQRVDLAAAVAAFEAQGSVANLAAWVAAVERCATRAGYLLAADLEVAANILRAEPRAVLDAEAKIADLLAFAVSDEHHALRAAMGIAIEP
jgi:tetratricopeptide (TPR) repeat protein